MGLFRVAVEIFEMVLFLKSLLSSYVKAIPWLFGAGALREYLSPRSGSSSDLATALSGGVLMSVAVPVGALEIAANMTREGISGIKSIKERFY